MTRPDRDDWHFKGANWLAEMGDCTRRQVGALIVGPDKRFWGMGYNGGRPGGPSCLDGACPRGRHYQFTCMGHGHPESGNRQGCRLERSVTYCACGKPWPCPDSVAPGSSYDTGPGACTGSHAEMNAKNDALRRGGGDLAGCVMYVNAEPCEGCIREIRNNTRISAIMWRDGNDEGMVALP